MKRAAALSVVKKLADSGFEAYFAGGCVRDELLGAPASDFDVATSATPDEVAKAFDKTVPIGERFGVALVILDGFQIEVATFRGESGYSDGRRPDNVYYSTAREDVLRRDFTINGMLMNPLTGEIFDWVGGREDLKKRIIRTIGEPEERFGEDRLRMLRAVRLAAKLSFNIEEKTAASIKKMAAQILLVSPERVRDEILKMMATPNRAEAILAMHELDLLRPYLPEVENLANIRQSKEFHPEGDALTHTALALKYLPENAAPELCIATLLHDVGKGRTLSYDEEGGAHFPAHEFVGEKMATKICKRLKMPSKTISIVSSLVAGHMDFYGIDKRRPGKLKQFLSRGDIELLLELHRADSLASDGDLSAYEFCRNKLAEMKEKPQTPPRKLVTGDDLKAMGYKEGPAFREILTAVDEAALDEKIFARHDALEFVKRHFPKEITEKPE